MKYLIFRMIDPVKAEMFTNRLAKVFKHKNKLAKRQGVTCYRIYDHDMPEFPFSIELYENNIYIAEYLRRHGMEDDQHEAWLMGCLSIIQQITGVPTDNMYCKQRKRQSHREGQYEKLATEQIYFTIKENGLEFLVNLTDYLDTGLFLDHRITREKVKQLSAGKRVLNLFCYTSSFSVYAAAGGAGSVSSVDLSKTYLGWSEKNMELNEFNDKTKYQYIHADVKQFLKTLKPNSYDLVIMDPPTFSNSKRMKDILDIQRDHVELINDMLNAMTIKGVLFFSTNFTKFEMDVAAIPTATIKNITKATTPFDFEGKLKRWCYEITKK